MINMSLNIFKLLYYAYPQIKKYIMVNTKNIEKIIAKN